MGSPAPDIRVIWTSPEESVVGEDGYTEFLTRCTLHGRLANMVWKKRGPRGGIRPGFVIGCTRECGEQASTQ